MIKNSNEWADFWYYERGANVFPANTKTKQPFWTDKGGKRHYITWEKSGYQVESITEDQFKEWKDNNAFKDGLAVICGKVFRGKDEGLYINGLDLDNKKALNEFIKNITLKKYASSTLVEQHREDKAHVYYLTKEPVKSKGVNDKVDKNGNTLPLIEVKSEGNLLLYCAGGVSKDGKLIDIVGTKEIKQLDKEKLENKINDICKINGIAYLNGVAKAEQPVSNLIKDDFVIYKGENRSGATVKYLASKYAKNREISEKTLIILGLEWSTKHCIPIHSESEMRKLARDSMSFIEKRNTSPELQKQLDENWEVLKSKPTKIEKKQAQKKINELNKLAGYDERDWSEEEKGEDVKLLELAMTKIEKIVISESNQHEVHAVVKIDNHYEPIEIGGSRSEYWLNHLLSNELKTNSIHAKDFYKKILEHIIAKAQMEKIKREYIYNRISYQNNKLYYYLNNENFDIVVLSKDNINEIQLDVDTPIFSQNQASMSQVKPIFDDSNALNEFVELLQIKDKQLFKVHLIALFLEHIPVPVMLFDGKAGSFKTTTTAFIKKIIDPSGNNKESNVVAINSNLNDLIMTIYNRYLTVFENVSKIDNETSDIFCRSTTGASNIKRGLYTNLEEVILTFKRKLIINGITPNLDNGDLQQRLISYDREIVNFVTEDELNIKYDNIRPRVLGQIFTILQKVLCKIDNFDYQPKTRMADFEKWGELISQELGYDVDSFIEVYDTKMISSAISSKDAHPIIEIIENMMEEKKKDKKKEEIHDSIAKLFISLKAQAEGLGIDTENKYVKFPKAPNQLTKELVLVTPILEKIGFTISIWNNSEVNNFKKNAKLVRIMTNEFQMEDKL